MVITHHARIRCQQRGISSQVLAWLLEYGSKEHAPHGEFRRTFDHRAVARMAHALGRDAVERLGARLNVYAVVNEDDVVITAAHRLKRFKKP